MRFLTLFAVCGSLWGGIVTIRGDEVVAPANGLSVKGVRFSFEVGGEPSNDAIFGATGPGDLKFVQDPSLVGPTENSVLSFRFSRPTNFFTFGLALSGSGFPAPGATVSVFDSESNLLLSESITVTTETILYEAFFSYLGVPAHLVRLQFASDLAPFFAFDNLEFESGVPEPSTATTFGSLALVAISYLLARRRGERSSTERI